MELKTKELPKNGQVIEMMYVLPDTQSFSGKYFKLNTTFNKYILKSYMKYNLNLKFCQQT